ncbi:hypothetical protein EWE75_06860 [Sphingomonas populi]|uniref:Uncharacterized protein n=1 Tax=Sphingomonas populi TaxID=2484750 RepID=A0A4Q6Y5C3_9SPHN|nr:STY0301 family protein [Sphingomonas populi]RZF65094.1 hypothetical protein EWE75_06860 [Sphingomonas populi]
MMPALTLVLALAAHTDAPAQAGTACPARWAGLPLKGGVVYDGPPGGNAILKPEDGDRADNGTSTWPGLAYIYQMKRKVWLGCSYVDDAAIYVPVERPVRMCRYVARRGLVRLYCR